MISKVLCKNYIQPSLQLQAAVLQSIALQITIGSWYSACTFPLATSMAKGTWWIRLYWHSSNRLSKYYDCLPTPWLNYCNIWSTWFDNIRLKLFHSYFSNWKQIVKIGSTISEWINILTEIPQGSILGPLIFNIFINDLIMLTEKPEICNFTDTSYKSSPSLLVVLNCLEHDILKIVLNWFKVNSLKANPKDVNLSF